MSALEEQGNLDLTRRQFLGSATVAGALVIAAPVVASRRAEAAGAGGTVTVFVTVNPDESVTIVCPNSEMGQGTSTALPQLVAEELMVDWSKVRMQLADANSAYNNPMMWSQATGGSTAVRGYFSALRQAGAQAREMLVGAAMADVTIAGLGGATRDIYAVASGVVTNTTTGATATYGQLASAAASVTLTSTPALIGSNRIVGQSVQRLDIPAKVDGSAVFGFDVRLPGMKYAAVRLAPKVGQTLATVGAPPAGVQVVQLYDEKGATRIGVAAVVADSSWSAMKAVRALTVTWTNATYTASTDSATIRSTQQSLLTSGTPIRGKKSGDAETAIAGAAKTVTATYSAPFVAHATMEPMNATAKYVPGVSLEIWAPTQNQSGCVSLGASLTTLPASAVKVHTTYLGGGLGRKYETDFVNQAIQVAKAVPNTPVKTVWAREQDFTHDVYRPASMATLRAGLDASGNPVGYTARSAVQSLFASRWGLAPGSVDSSAVEGLIVDDGQETVAYATLGANQTVEWVWDKTTQVPVGFWRSVGHSANVFYLESFLDELAKAAGKDPMAFRQSMLRAGSRDLAVLQTLATASAWSTKVSGVGKGVAMSRSFGGTIAAAVAEVSGTSTSIKVGKITVVLDCGTVVNPDIVKAQVESAVLQGLAAAMWQDVPFVGGVPTRQNFGTYRMGKMADAPVIAITIMPGNGNPPGGVGEPALPPVAPAIGNAIAALTGVRKRALPFFPQAAPTSYITT
ncbi:MAG: molybdopterin cofactor-binding domain-containing protein [Actinomycetota bacterium]